MRRGRIIFIGGLFLYYKKDLQEIQLDEMQISETVNTYLDRNGKVLWQDTGSEDYRLVGKKDEISPYMYQATIAIEDKNFYNHPGVDFIALIRATFSTLTFSLYKSSVINLLFFLVTKSKIKFCNFIVSNFRNNI